MFYHAIRTATRRGGSGKFPQRKPLAGGRPLRDEYRGWRYELRYHSVGMTVRRESFSASVFDPAGGTGTYLRGFAGLAQARRAAESWIDRQINTRGRTAAERKLREPGDRFAQRTTTLRHDRLCTRGRDGNLPLPSLSKVATILPFFAAPQGDGSG